MKKYICKGATIQSKQNDTKTGIVFALDKKSDIVVAQSGNSFWSDRISNVEVVSYKEVK